VVLFPQDWFVLIIDIWEGVRMTGEDERAKSCNTVLAGTPFVFEAVK
jgi:hypothetical protein